MLAAGCGRSEPARSAEPEVGPTESRSTPSERAEPSARDGRAAVRRAAPRIEVEGEVGGLDQEAVDEVVAAASRDFERCWDQGVERNELVAGTIQLVVGVGGDGRVLYAYAKQSTLGDGEMQRCMLRALSARPFPKPVGGKVGVVRTSHSFDLSSTDRAPTQWSSSAVSAMLGDAREEIEACKQGTSGSFTATAYVKQIELPPPDADAGDGGEDAGDAGDAGPTWAGAAFDVGVAVSDEHGAAAVDCLERVLSRAVYPAPGERPAKVTFSL